ncbi:peptide hydrolase [Trypanosoma cruzi]|nr:peptide hydrolase [Trypanosoma cruzi]
MHIRRERSVVSAPLTEGAHTQEGAAHTATQKQSNNTRRRSPHTTRIVGPRELQPIFTTSSSFAVGLRPHSSHSISCRPGHHRNRSCCTRNKKQEREVVWETTVLLSLSPCEAVFMLLVAVAMSLVNPSLWAAGVTVPADVPSVLLLHSSSPLLLWRVRRPLRSGGSHYDWSWWCWRRR